MKDEVEALNFTTKQTNNEKAASPSQIIKLKDQDFCTKRTLHKLNEIG